MIDRNGKLLSVGDPVTVRYPSDRPLFHNGSHARVVSFGTKRVKIKMETAAFPGNDGLVETFLSEDLEHGHNGTPRNSDRMMELASDFGRGKLEQTLDLAVEQGVVTAEQAEQIKDLWPIGS